MKRFKCIFCLFFLLTILVFSCSKSEGLLSGKHFMCESCCIKDDIFTSFITLSSPMWYLEDFNTNLPPYRGIAYGSGVSWIGLPDDCFERIGVKKGEFTYPSNTEIVDSIYTVNFFGTKCILNIHTSKCQITKGQELECYMWGYKFNEGVYVSTINPHFSIIVTSDNIQMLNDEQPFNSISLNDYVYWEVGKCNYTKIHETPNDLKEIFEYSIDGNDILIWNSSKRLRGTIDLFNKVLTLQQTDPIKLRVIELTMQ